MTRPPDRPHDPPPDPADASPSDGDRPRRAIVVGYGLVGRLTDQRLTADGIVVTIIEMNLDTIQAQLGLERRCTYGDARTADTLRRAGLDRADALIVTVPDEDAAVEIVRVARRLRPGLYIAARTNFVSRGLKARAMGANDVVIEEIVTAEAMERLVRRNLCRSSDPDRREATD
jgi:CPA2 family monovalent cation:H+ antiporter-2